MKAEVSVLAKTSAGFFAIILFVSLTAYWVVHLKQGTDSTDRLDRYTFPSGFIFGTSASAYQYEGAANEDGKGPNIWDTFTHLLGATTIEDGSNGDVAVDQYHKYMEDIKLMSSLGVDSYRFSISWARILPNGTGEINREGIKYYNLLINALLRYGIKPMVTLYHFDLPQALEDEYHGWLSPRIIDDFQAYAEICFMEFGDRVKYWITMNEPNMFVPMGYTVGKYPPSHCSLPVGNCTRGNSSEAYLATHHVLLAHAAAVQVFREKYQHIYGGLIGFSLNTPWYEPLSDTAEDRDAADRIFAFNVRWFFDPIVYGQYPKVMRDIAKTKLPEFTANESLSLKKSFDFLGLNYYYTVYATSSEVNNTIAFEHFYPDANVHLTGERNGVLIGEKTGLDGLFSVPHGIQDLVEYLTILYDRPPIIVTENGYGESVPKYQSWSIKRALNDLKRIKFHKEHLTYLARSMRNGADVRGYYVWSLLDNFEWSFGYTVKFGLCYVDGKTQGRRPKISARWFQNFLKKQHRHTKPFSETGTFSASLSSSSSSYYPRTSISENDDFHPSDCVQSRDVLGGFCSYGPLHTS